MAGKTEDEIRDEVWDGGGYEMKFSDATDANEEVKQEIGELEKQISEHRHVDDDD